MHAHLGDRLVVESSTTGVVRRDGEIVGLHHEDGTPPYDVRWSDTENVTLMFPGPDAHIQHLESEETGTADGTSPPVTGEQPATAPGTPNPGDIGRRVAVERRRRGLSREETARAGHGSRPSTWRTSRNSRPTRPPRPSSPWPAPSTPPPRRSAGQAPTGRPARVTPCRTRS